MTEEQRRTIKDALFKCAKEQKNIPVCTGWVVPSTVCKAAAERIEELEKETKRLSAVDEINELLLKQQNSLKKEVHNLRRENKELRCCGNCDNNAYCDKEHHGNDKGCKEWEYTE